MNNTVNKEVKERNGIFAVLMEIISRDKSDIKEDRILNERLEQIYIAQSELGATDSIAALERNMETHITSEKTAKKINTTRISRRSNESEIEYTIQENTLNQENNIER